MVIATSITKSYLDRSQPFFESVNKHFTGRKVCFTIGFITTIEGWECIETPLPECKWQPTNRKEYYSLQHGEWIKYIELADDEMILFCDSDMVLQRPFDLEFPVTHKIGVTRCVHPAIPLLQVSKNIHCKLSEKQLFTKFKEFQHLYRKGEFCACFIVASFASWKLIYKLCKQNYFILNWFTHHAAWQFLINCSLFGTMRGFVLPEYVVNASWYEGMGAVDKDGVLMYRDEVVYFNHTKFN